MRKLFVLSPVCLTALLVAGSALAQEHAEETEASLFAGTIYQSIAALIAFGIVFFVLAKYAWGPIIKGLQDRENKIKDDLQQARDANDRAQATLADYEQKIAAAHAEARQLIDAARSDGDKVRQRMVTETETEIARLRDRAADQIEQAKQAAVADIYARTADLAVAVAGKILQRQINEQDTQQLVEQSLAELRGLQNRN